MHPYSVCSIFIFWIAPSESLQSIVRLSRTVILFSWRNSIVSVSESNANCDVTIETGKFGRNLERALINRTNCRLLILPCPTPTQVHFPLVFFLVSHKYDYSQRWPAEGRDSSLIFPFQMIRLTLLIFYQIRPFWVCCWCYLLQVYLGGTNRVFWFGEGGELFTIKPNYALMILGTWRY